MIPVLHRPYEPHEYHTGTDLSDGYACSAVCSAPSVGPHERWRATLCPLCRLQRSQRRSSPEVTGNIMPALPSAAPPALGPHERWRATFNSTDTALQIDWNQDRITSSFADNWRTLLTSVMTNEQLNVNGEDPQIICGKFAIE